MWTCITHNKQTKYGKKIVRKLKRQWVHLKDPSVSGRMILKRILNDSGLRLWTMSDYENSVTESLSTSWGSITWPRNPQSSMEPEYSKVFNGLNKNSIIERCHFPTQYLCCIKYTLILSFNLLLGLLIFLIPSGNPFLRQIHACCLVGTLNPSQAKRSPLYLKTQSVPRCKHFSSGL